jgi:outer membrane protein OmpA-like peptidoglycan-associated protein
MKIRTLICIIAQALVSGSAMYAQDAEGTKDTPYVSRMPNFFITESNTKDFDAYKFCSGGTIVTVEGQLHQNHYQIKEGAAGVSSLQILRNYGTAIKGLGGTIVSEKGCEEFDDTRSGAEMLTGKILKGGREVWVEVLPWNSGEGYQLTVLEKETMTQEVTASDLLAKLNTDGHVALYINFETNSAALNPDSKAAIDQVAQMLKQNQALQLSIEGHTDNTGTADRNKTLSDARAKSVMNALVAQGIAAGRLSAMGWGQDTPIADNGTDAGRAKNRRVELVKK